MDAYLGLCCWNGRILYTAFCGPYARAAYPFDACVVRGPSLLAGSGYGENDDLEKLQMTGDGAGGEEKGGHRR
jgi:hypothetical protein